MSIFDLDLDAKNYTISELMGLLDLNIPYSEDEIMESSDVIKNKILGDSNLMDEKKEELMKFILKVENILKLDLKTYFLKLSHLDKTNNFANIPEIDTKPDTNTKFKTWTKGATVLYYNKQMGKFQIYVKTSFVGQDVVWSIFNSE